mmetsp:Transcript_43595/g.108288  ORF Transcript_43595/g.108288 Transcript_43595/m.108288 type:complete len:106 (+) Transcript_43595:813-1130(+)
MSQSSRTPMLPRLLRLLPRLLLPKLPWALLPRLLLLLPRLLSLLPRLPLLQPTRRGRCCELKWSGRPSAVLNATPTNAEEEVPASAVADTHAGVTRRFKELDEEF